MQRVLIGIFGDAVILSGLAATRLFLRDRISRGGAVAYSLRLQAESDFAERQLNGGDRRRATVKRFNPRKLWAVAVFLDG